MMAASSSTTTIYLSERPKVNPVTVSAWALGALAITADVPNGTVRSN